jgi:HrpA-like RNA helicase
VLEPPRFASFGESTSRRDNVHIISNKSASSSKSVGCSINGILEQWNRRQQHIDIMLIERSSLPIYQHKERILELVKTHSVTIIGSEVNIDHILSF